MARSLFGARDTCEACKSIDIRCWYREGRLVAGHSFSWSWSCLGESSGTINVRVEEDAVVLTYGARSLLAAEWKPIEQRVPITWTDCHFGGRRPWFNCCARVNDRYCGRRVAVLYAAGELFACRSCYNLAYESQQGSSTLRSLSRSLKIRVRLGGSPDPLGPFPEKPRGMHWRTYLRLRAHCEARAIAFGDARSSDKEIGATTDPSSHERHPKLKGPHNVPT
jgi:hypothetical protein